MTTGHPIWQEIGRSESMMSYDSNRMSFLSVKNLEDLGKEMDQAHVEDSGCLQHFVRHPDRKWTILWALFSCVMVMYDVIVLPWQFIGISQSPFTNIMAYIIPVFWSVDMPLQAFTGIFEQGRLEMRWRSGEEDSHLRPRYGHGGPAAACPGTTCQVCQASTEVADAARHLYNL